MNTQGQENQTTPEIEGTEAWPNTTTPQTPTAQPPDLSGTGYLTFRVTTANGAIPLEGAMLPISNTLPDFGEEGGGVYRVVMSDRDGNTEHVPLPAPPRSLSAQPGSTQKTYAAYNAEVHLEGYYSQFYYYIPIFDGITAVQNVDLVPLPENGETDRATPDNMRFYENEAPDL